MGTQIWYNIYMKKIIIIILSVVMLLIISYSLFKPAIIEEFILHGKTEFRNFKANPVIPQEQTARI